MSNPLHDIIPAKHRKRAYAVLTLGAIVLSVWQATEGDPAEMAAGILAALGFGVATSNTDGPGL